MKRMVVTWLVVALVMLVLDLVWLGGIARDFYARSLGHLLAEQPNLLAAALFYLLYPVGLVVFAVADSDGSAEAGRTSTRGALFGFFAYATYDLSNLATLRDWPVTVTLVDVAWGTFASAVAAMAGRVAMRRLGH